MKYEVTKIKDRFTIMKDGEIVTWGDTGPIYFDSLEHAEKYIEHVISLTGQASGEVSE